MAPFVTERVQVPSSSSFEHDATFDTPFSRAVNGFLMELNAEDDPRNPFLRELKLSRKELANVPGCKTEAQASAAKLKDFMEDLQTKKSSGRGMKLLARVEPFIDSLARVMGLCESMFNAAPFGVSVAFSGARIVLKLASQMHSCLESIVDAMEQIGISLKCYDKFAQAFPRSDDMQGLLASSYKNIVSFWFNASRILSRHSLLTVVRGATKSIEKEIKTALEGLASDRDNVIALAQATTAEEAIRTKEATLKQGVMNWIKSGSNVDLTPIVDEQLSLRVEGTCNWLFEDKRFQEWLDAMDNAALWYNAKPGSGKTVYAATIIDHLRSRDKKVVYFFYSFNSPRRKLAISGLRSLALQLLDKFVTDTPDKVVQRYKDEFGSSADGIESIHSASHVVHDLLTQCPETFVLVDGIDECLDDDVLLITLQHLMKTPTYGLVKWLFTSRNSPKIRSVMEACQAIEIEAPASSISNDIRTYLSRYITCQHCINKRSEDEDNFLYSKLICDTLRGEGLTTDAEIREALKRYPKDLNGYYMRVLEKLSKKTEQQQELARRVFLILIAAAQSMSLDEIRNALAIAPNVQDHDPSRVPYVEEIESLCSPLVTFARPKSDDSDDNPLLKLCHKTVEDFFLQDPDTLDLASRSGLCKYFVNYRQASQAMAMDCLTYLQYKRYESPTLKIGAILSRPIAKEHAFLPYAATFWAQHCDWLGQHPAEKVVHAVLQFLQSPTLPTCLEVQAHVGPYLFGRYVDRRKRPAYKMCVKGSRQGGDDSFGVPLPQWLDKISSQGYSLDRSMCHFISEWREVLIQHPDRMEFCLPLRNFEDACHLARPRGHKYVSVAHLEEQCKHLIPSGKLVTKDYQILRVAFHGTTLWVDVLLQHLHGAFKLLQIPLFTKKKSVILSDHSALLPDGDLLDWIMSATREKENRSIGAWKADPHDLSIRKILNDRSNHYKVPLAFSSASAGRRKGSWEVQSEQSFEFYRERGSLQVAHFTWRSNKHVDGTNFGLPFKQHQYSDSSSSESGEEEEDIPSPASPESMSDDDSDDDSKAESTTTPSRATETAEETSWADSDSDTDEGQMTDCLILIPSEHDPSWYTWSGTHQIWARIGCAVHPTLRLLAVSHTARQLELIDTVTGTKKTKHLPDLADLQDAPLASLRELRFSPCGNYLHFLSIAFIPQSEAASTEARVTLTTFNFNHQGNSEDTLFRECSPKRCTYSFGETLANVPLPLALTYWSDTEVIVALPPLTCDPKILKIMLPSLPPLAIPGPEQESCADGNNIVTLKRSIYFPTSTPNRQARVMYRNEGQSGIEAKGRLYLVLDRLLQMDAADDTNGVETSEKTTDGSPSNNNDGHEAAAPELGQASPPVVLRWKIEQDGGWRAWDPEMDSKASDLKREVPVWKMLRGQFVDSDKLFSVPIRSGLDWTRKGYLSCGAMG